MDHVIKKYYDQYRGTLPPEIKGKVEGVLMKDLALMEKWRNWKTGLEYVDKALGVTLFGALDECLVDKDVYIPLDYKTRGSEPKKGDSERYYQTQLDAYNYLLDANGYKTKGLGYLVYYYPGEVKAKGAVRFEVETVKIKTSLERLQKLLESAVSILKGPLPAGTGECEYCNYVNGRMEEGV